MARRRVGTPSGRSVGPRPRPAAIATEVDSIAIELVPITFGPVAIRPTKNTAVLSETEKIPFPIKVSTRA
jgi:hypothetical protein